LDENKQEVEVWDVDWSAFGSAIEAGAFASDDRLRAQEAMLMIRAEKNRRAIDADVNSDG
jgi:hypothetical protein